MNVTAAVFVAFSGIFGVLARYGLNDWFLRTFNDQGFVHSTMFINILGSFLIGLVFVIPADTAWLSPEMRLGCMAGFLGGFTTFSGFSLQIAQLYEQGALSRALFILCATPLLCVLATASGFWFGRKVF